MHMSFGSKPLWMYLLLFDEWLPRCGPGGPGQKLDYELIFEYS